MSTDKTSPSDDPSSDRSLSVLMKAAGERRPPRAEAMERAREAARASWQQSVQSERKSRRTRTFLACAASATFACAALASWVLYQRHDRTPPVLVAHVVASEGVYELRGADDSSRMLTLEQPVFSGSRLQTLDGRVALKLGSLSLRLNDHTHLTLDSSDRITLVEGAIYVDSGGLNAATALRVATPAGEVTHLGTQFQVRVSGEATSVSVREGRVMLDGPLLEQAFDIAAGDALTVRGEKVEVQHNQPSYGAAWDWVTQVAPAFDIENRPLSEFVAWISREQGWQARYVSAEHERSAQTIRLHGSIEQLDTAQTLERITLVTGMPLGVENGVLLVGERAATGIVR